MNPSETDEQRQQYCESFLAAYRATRSPADVEAQHRQVLNRFVDEGVNVGNFDIMKELFAPSYVSHNPLGDQSREEVAATLNALREALTDFEMSIPFSFVEGNRAATLRIIKGTFDHELSTPNGAIPPTGKPVQVDMVCLLRFSEDGTLAEDWTQFDNLSLMTQLGVTQIPT